MSNQLWVQFVKALLHAPRSHASTPVGESQDISATPPLSVLLFVLDVRALVRNQVATIGSSSMQAGPSVAAGDGDGATEGELESKRTWERRNAGSSPSVSPTMQQGSYFQPRRSSTALPLETAPGLDADALRAYGSYLQELVSGRWRAIVTGS